MNLSLLIPEWTALGVLLVLLIGEISWKDFSRKYSGLVSLAGCGVVFLALLLGRNHYGSAFSGTFEVTPLSVFFKMFFILTLAPVIQMARDSFENSMKNPGEYLLILWCTLIGLFFLASAKDLLLLFISLEIVTLSFYITAAFLKKDLMSIEAGLKYLILGSLASAFLIYAISLLYVMTGTTSLDGIRTASSILNPPPLMMLSFVFLIAGVGFKIASVPFQLWVPDVYEGAPSPTVAFLSVGSKAAGFLIGLKVLVAGFPFLSKELTLLFSVLAALTILYGNLGALLQTNVKRLFAYSSITHAGYLMIGIAAGKVSGVQALLFYLAAYGVSNLAAFSVITLVGKALKNDRLETYKGLSQRSPYLAGMMFLALLSLAGVPPLAGFFGKFYILLAAVQAGLSWLALLGLLAVSISLFYYLTLVKKMYIEESVQTSPIQVSSGSRVLLAVLALLIIVVGLWQAPLLSWAGQAAASLF